MLPNPSYCKNSPKSQPLTVLGFSKITTVWSKSSCYTSFVHNHHVYFSRNSIKLAYNGASFMPAEGISTAMFSISQPDLLVNSTRKYTMYCHITGAGTNSRDFQWSPFPTEMPGVSVIVPSPSGSKLLLVRNGEKGCPTKLEIVDQSHVAKDIHVGQSMHGPLYTDEW